jgi:hypothetical protein
MPTRSVGRRLKKNSNAILVALMFTAWPSGFAAADELEPKLEAAVTTLSMQLSDGIATYIGGQAAYGATGSPFEGQVAVLFGLTSWGGGNGSIQFLAVYTRLDESISISGRRFQPFQLLAVAQVGEDFERWFKAIRLERDRIVVEGGRWLKSDAHCCPTGTARAVYRLGRGGLDESAR